jgi:histidine ammonia-lyase
MPALDGRSLTLEQLAAVADAGEAVSVTADARAHVDAARRTVEAVLEGETPVYGVNTGFGSFAEVRIAHADHDHQHHDVRQPAGRRRDVG